MRIYMTVATGFGLALLTAAPALAGNERPTLYPYPATENYCPIGLQPVVLGGVISCGMPTTSITYEDVMRQPLSTRRSYSARIGDCRVGVKGCY